MKNNNELHTLKYNNTLNNKVVDPEMLFVECSRCGSPIIWEEGRATEILRNAGIDALELDHHCLLVTDGCPRCTKGKMYRVQVYRVETEKTHLANINQIGHA